MLWGSYGMHYQLNARCHLIRHLIELALADTSLCECHKMVSGFNKKIWINRRRAAKVQKLQWALRCNSPYSFSTYVNMLVEASQRIWLKQKSITCFQSLPPRYLTRRTNFDIIVTSRSAKMMTKSLQMAKQFTLRVIVQQWLASELGDVWKS